MQIKRNFFYVAVVFIALILIVIFFFRKILPLFYHPPTIKVGILHSLTGTMSISEKPVVDAVLLAIDEINEKGGVFGAKITPVIADGKSDPDTFQSEAERLIIQENVKVIFGCWTSASRKAVKPIIEKYNSILFYPVQYEGLEQSPNIVYLGPVPNQQLIPVVKWASDNLGKKFFLVGSDYIFPRVENEIAKDVIGYLGGTVVGEEYAILGSKSFLEIAKKIKEAKPDVILNTINGDSNIAFFESLRALDVPKIPIMSLSITENEIKAFREYLQANSPNDAKRIFQDYMVGSYACWNYFESINSFANITLIDKFVSRYGKNYNVTDPAVAAYFGVYLWSKAVNEGKDIDNPKNIMNYLHRLSIPTPKGILTIADNNHARQTTFIGKLNDKGIFEIVWASQYPVDPVIYPPFREKESWNQFVEHLYQQWGSRWTANVIPAN